MDVKEQMAKKLFNMVAQHRKTYGLSPMRGTWEEMPDKVKQVYYKWVDQILAIEVGKLSLEELIKLAEQGRLEVRAENQKLPPMKHKYDPRYHQYLDAHHVEKNTRAYILSGDRDTHWVKVLRNVRQSK